MWVCSGLGRVAAGGTSSQFASVFGMEVRPCGRGRILTVMRFPLNGDASMRRFEARCEYGGLPEWRASGEWVVQEPGNILAFTGMQKSAFLLTTGYRWGMTLDPLGQGVLHGESVSGEPTMWSRRQDFMSIRPTASMSRASKA